MSYSRSFIRTVGVPYSGSKTVSYPPSKNGGSMTVSYSGTAYEDVEVNVHVDTTPFDASVSNCNSDVNMLTSSVGAMNAAQCLAIENNADKVSKTIINGFFHTVRTDLGTQQVELQQAIEARLLLLQQQSASLLEKRETMTKDYERTTARYRKIFDDLNDELSRRVHELDQPVFDAIGNVDSLNNRMLHTSMIQTASTTSKESSVLQAQIGVATVKKHVLEAMSKVQNFLTSKASSEHTIKDTAIEGNGSDRYLLPVCYVRTESENHQVQKTCYIHKYNLNHVAIEKQLCDILEMYDFPRMPDAEISQVKSYVQTEMFKSIPGDDSHSRRVREMINKMLNR